MITALYDESWPFEIGITFESVCAASPDLHKQSLHLNKTCILLKSNQVDSINLEHIVQTISLMGKGQDFILFGILMEWWYSTIFFPFQLKCKLITR